MYKLFRWRYLRSTTSIGRDANPWRRILGILYSLPVHTGQAGMILTSSSALLRCHIPRSESRADFCRKLPRIQHPKSAGLRSAPRTGSASSHGRPASQEIWRRWHGIPDTAFPRQYAEFECKWSILAQLVGLLKGCASVLSTHSSKSTTDGSLKMR